MYHTYLFSVTDTGSSALITAPATSEDDQALLERLAKREERRQRRMREALERQKEFDPTITDGEATITTSEDRPSRRSRLGDREEETTNNEVPSSETNSWTEKEEKNKDENVEESKVEVQETVPVKEEPVAEPASEEPKDTQEDIVEKKEEEEEVERPRRSYLREQVISSKS